MEDPPSFIVGIIQIMLSDTNRVYEHEDIGWVYNRSNKLSDSLVMANGEYREGEQGCVFLFKSKDWEYP